MNKNTPKEIIGRRFGKAAAHYDRYARLQRESALVLAPEIEAAAADLPPGPVLEVGCGTGTLTRVLARSLPGRPLVAVDLAPEMAMTARQRVGGGVCAVVADGEDLPLGPGMAGVVSGLTLQWFADWRSGLAGLYRRLLPGGILICSWLGAGSFAEWRRVCRRTGLVCTANPLPPADLPAQVPELGGRGRSWQRVFVLEYPSAAAFFHSLKMTGTAAAPAPRLATADLRALIHAWDAETGGSGVRVSYEVCYYLVSKPKITPRHP